MKHNFKELKIWKESIELVKLTYLLSNELPDNEKFGLKSQIQRSAVSIPSNIAEGSSRSSNKDFSRFLEIAVGSAYEVETQLLIASDLGFVNNEESEKIAGELNEIVKMISRFRTTLKI